MDDTLVVADGLDDALAGLPPWAVVILGVAFLTFLGFVFWCMSRD